MRSFDFFKLNVLSVVSCIAFFACSDLKEDPESEIEVQQKPKSVPTVVTGQVSDVTDVSATASISITSDGGAAVTVCGIVWDEEPNPTEDLPTKVTFDGKEETYTCQLTDLNTNTTYYYRAYATNEAGTAYGEEYSFTTGIATTMSVDVNGIVIDLVLVEGGTFTMGATPDLMALAQYDPDELPAHKVTLDSYYMGKYEVTQELWIEIMGANPSQMIRKNECPVDGISYLQCLEFVKKLNERTGLRFSLPTEAQWEYAARGGNKSQGFLYSGSNDATEVGWVEENMVEFGQHPGGEKAPNELGIYDMTGNINEWCLDIYGPYPAEPQTNPTGAELSGNSALYVVRGGSFLVQSARWCRNTKRISYPDMYTQMDIGMRLVLKDPASGPDPEPEISAPTVVTGQVSDVTDISATASLTIASDGGAAVTVCGIVWDEEPNPTEDLSTKITFDGTEANYTYQLTGLNAGTTYYYRAYATNEAGTAYGNEYSFTTESSSESTMSVDVNGIVIDLILVEGGTFTMGATPDLIELAKYDEDELPAHEVTLDSYYMGKYEVTQELWIEIMGANPSMMIKKDECPVDGMNYLQCLEFIKKLNERTGMHFSLPTEAQWEYAARGGNKSKGFLYSGSNDPTEVGWVGENMAEFGQHPGGGKAPNELGIYDMTGNLNEWCLDYYGPYPAEPQTNPTGPEDNQYTLRVVRGGAFHLDSAGYSRNTKRQSYPENYSVLDIGLRLVLNINTSAE
ncbi:MAG: SUMF1/EgtB/PvdO family nonheme iron enzyme [Bacteroidales bacterium]|nr:SUMF1/EgtB/PvdO family nonheme iron enzyme [Bacteroidales bacterium]